VRDAVTLEHLGPAVVHRHGDRNRDRFLALAEHVDEVVVDVEDVCDAAQLILRDLEGVLAKVRSRGLGCRHGRLPFLDIAATF